MSSTRRGFLAAVAAAIAGSAVRADVAREALPLPPTTGPDRLSEARSAPTPVARPEPTVTPDPSPTPVLPATPLAEAAVDTIPVTANELTVRIRRDPWGLEGWIDGARILQEQAGAPEGSPYGTLGYQRAGSSVWYHLTMVQAITATNNGRRFLVRTSEPNAGLATVDVTIVGEGTIHIAFQPPAGAPVARCGFSARTSPRETFLGLGEQFGRVALAGRQVDLWAADRRVANYGDSTYLPVPWLISSRGFGFWLDDSRRSTWAVQSDRPDAWAVSAAGPGLAFSLIAGNPAKALERYTALSGRPPLPPDWAFGVVKTLIGGEQRVLADAARLRYAGIPVDGVFVFDAGDGAANIGWTVPTYDAIPRGTYGNLRRFTDALRLLGFRPLAYFTPDLRPGTPVYEHALQRGAGVHRADGGAWINPLFKIGLLDAFNPEAVRWWQDEPLKRALVDLGFDGGMLDLGEAVPAEARFVDGTTGEVAHNAYPVALAAAMDAGLRALKPDGTFWMRSGFAGGQRFHRGTWPGDAVNSWDRSAGLGGLVPAALGAGLAGYAYWHAEVGGYVDGGLSPASERELYFRWLQFSAFTTMLRDNYGDRRGKPTDIWTDDQTLDLWRRYAGIHQSLRPSLLKAAGRAHEVGLPLIRHLALAFPEEPRAWTEEQQYLLGDDLLVAPVTELGARQRKVYFPSGTWQDWWTGRHYVGPDEGTVPAPIDQIPVFRKVG